MEYSTESCHFLIESLRRNGMSATEIHSILETAWPVEAPSLRRVQTIVKEFNDGERTRFGRTFGSGRRKSDDRVRATEQVEEILIEDCSRTVRDLAEMSDLPKSTVHRIITEDLNRKWTLTRWVPYPLTEERKTIRLVRIQDLLEAFQSRTVKQNLITIDEKWFYCRPLRPRNKIGSWVSSEGDCLKTPRRMPMEKKFMAIVAVDLHGYHFFKVLNRNQSVTSVLYTTFLDEMAQEYSQYPNPILMKNASIIHDNARPHVARATQEYLLEKGVRQLKQPPYSPDCNLCDRFIFPRLESARKESYETKEELEAFLQSQLPNFHRDRMKAALNDMIHDFEAIVESGGDYL